VPLPRQSSAWLLQVRTGAALFCTCTPPARNPGAPEVQNPNGLSEWIDRTFGFNPEQVYLYTRTAVHIRP